MTIRAPDAVTVPEAPSLPDDPGALARLAFGSSGAGLRSASGARHLAWLAHDALDLDLSDPAQATLGDYTLREKLGQGGMGVVYRAYQQSLDREVAVKLLSAGPWAAADFVERFRREARSAARLQHPNIVAIHEVGTEADLNWFSMQLVRGPSLAARLAADGPLAPHAAARLMREVAEAVDYAHRLGILHLDLKPANVLTSEDGEPLVADFGLARRLDESLAIESDEVSGTPSYMAPEQATTRSHRLSAATDIYGLGAILYELLTGRPPFLGATPHDTLREVCERAPAPLRTLDPRMPADLDAVVMKCLAKAPQDRYASARELAEELGRFVEGRAVRARPLGPVQRSMRWARREPRLAWAVAALVAALVAGLDATLMQWRRAEDHALEASRNLWSARANAAQAALAAGDGFAGLRHFVANLAEMEAAGRHADAMIERQRIGTILANAPELVAERGFESRTQVSAATFSPDGTRLAIATRRPGVDRTVQMLDAATLDVLWSTPTKGLTNGEPRANGRTHESLVFAQDGTRLVARIGTLRFSPVQEYGDAVLLDARTGDVLAPPSRPDEPFSAAYSADARYALVHRVGDPGTFVGAVAYEVEGWRELARVDPAPDTWPVHWLVADDGSWVLGTKGMVRATLYDARTLAIRWHHDVADADIGISAWRSSHDGRHLAIGYLSGAVELFDATDGSRVRLAGAGTERVHWLAFDRADSLLAAAGWGGTVHVWDTAAGVMRVAPLALERNHMMRGLRIEGERLFATSEEGIQSWWLPPADAYEREAVQAGVDVATGTAWPQGYDFHARSGLLATGGHSVRTWRMRATALKPAAAAPLPVAAARFDGALVVDVVDRAVTLRDATSGATVSPRFEHDEPVRVAAIATGGSLVTVAGRTVRVIDIETGALRGAPIVLPASPQRAAFARDAPLGVFATGDYEGGGLGEQLHVVDLHSGGLRGPALRVEGLVGRLEVAPDGKHALLLRDDPRARASLGGIVIVALESGRHPCSTSGLPAVYDAVFARDGRHLFAVDYSHMLSRVDLGSCGTEWSAALGGSGDFLRLASTHDGVAVLGSGESGMTVFGSGGARAIEAPPETSARAVVDVSGDGRRIAIASRNAAHVFDVESGERLSPPFALPIRGDDSIVSLAFSPDATRLHARTSRRAQAVWEMPSDPRPLDVLEGHIERLTARTRTDTRHLFVPAAPPAATTHAPERRPYVLPPTPARADARFEPLDLDPIGPVDLAGFSGPLPLYPANFPTLARGPHRLRGVDWNIGGAVRLLGPAEDPRIERLPSSTAAIPVETRDPVAVHVLVHLVGFPGSLADPLPVLRVVLVGADGRETALDVLTKRDVTSLGQYDLAEPTARLALLAASTNEARERGAMGEYTPWLLFAPRLEVPVGLPPTVAIRLEAASGALVLVPAVTLEARAAPQSVSATPP